MEEVMPKEEAQKPVDFKLRDGMLVEVLTMTNQTTFVGRVEQYTGGVLTIRESMGRDLPPVLYNREIKLRFFLKQTNLVLQGQVCGSSREIWKVDRLKKQYVEEKRAFFRQHVKLEAQAQCIERSKEEPDLSRGVKLSPCKVLDVSAGGFQISSREPFQVGDRLLVKDVTITPEVGPFSFTCRVQRVRQEESNFLCGCQIETLPDKEQDRLVQAIFIAQRKEIQVQKERG